ncbi:hypothetical protein H312_01537 [Anncaliia algerae PRA339]|uniref:PWWP domain-containing protein n=1 Tax=Anncaliia algerae PRA339 TaxID=1288291 RepID=A0A059F291_9MICR|nr:hypothetical protein H312_01537 [Anncaliia algerae PRA339]
MKYNPNDIVFTMYDEYPPWPSKIAPKEITDEVLARNNTEGIVVMFYGEELSYGVIKSEKDIIPFEQSALPENADEEMKKAYAMAKENTVGFPDLDPPTKKELINIEKWKKRMSQKKGSFKKENKVDEDVKRMKTDVSAENKKTEESEPQKEKNNEIKDIFFTNQEEIKENKISEELKEKIETEMKEEKERNPQNSINSINKEEERAIINDITQNILNSKETTTFLDKENKVSLSQMIPGLSVKEESIRKKMQKNNSLFLKAFLKTTKKKKYLKIKKELSKILLNYPKDTLRTNKIVNKLEEMSKVKIIKSGLFTPLVNLYLMDWLNDPLEIKNRCEKIIRKIIE